MGDTLTDMAIDRGIDGWATDWPEDQKTPAWEPFKLSYTWAEVPDSLKPGHSDRAQAEGFGRFMRANRDFRAERAAGVSEHRG